MKRFAMKQLQSWKEKGKRKPMIIMGARQVGKMSRFAQNVTELRAKRN